MVGSSEFPPASDGPSRQYQRHDTIDHPERTPSPPPQQQQHFNATLEDIDEKRAMAARNDEKKHRAPSIATETLSVHERDNVNPMSPSGLRADASRLEDDLELLRAERLISNQEHDMEKTMSRHRRHDTEVEDTFNPPVAEKDVKAVTNKKDENALLYKLWKFLRKFPRFIRYLVYLIPGATVLLTPILLGILAVNQDTHPVGGPGGTYLMWFGIWLEIVWCSLWVSRMITSLMPNLFLVAARISGSTNAKKWKDIGQQLELHTALFLWMLAVLISFKPTVDEHRVPWDGHDGKVNMQWINVVFKVIIALFVLAALNFVEKILIQWIATAFHERTYATRIANNKGDISQLVELFEYSKTHLESTDSFWQGSAGGSHTGANTPMQAMQAFGENAKNVVGKIGAVAGRVGNDFIGRKKETNHPRKVVSELLRTTSTSHTLARLIYRSLVREGQEMVFLEDMKKALKTEAEAEAAFNVFDKDLNGDISMDEFETTCNEIGMEKKAIAASLKDLDSVIKKLDKVFLFIICIITIIVFISIISGSAAAGLASAGSSVLGLAWMLQATAQEFLQSIIFVFIKHPFDVGDRVTIYGSTGANMTGDDYYVSEISLLYTEFKKLQGHIVQAPNSLLNTLFILNQRRSNGLADPIPLQIRFGTPAWMIDELKDRMLEFCLANKRDYQGSILSELSAITDQRSATLTVVFFHKSNFQNELLRITRHNNFMVELMAQMARIGIQGPIRLEPGGSRENPMYWAGMQPPPYTTNEGAYNPHAPAEASESAAANRSHGGLHRIPSIRSGSSARGAAQQMSSIETNLSNFGDVYENRRDQVLASRLASIKEKERAQRKKAEAERESIQESEPRASTSGLAPQASTESQSQSRSRLFGRARSSSKLGRQDSEIV